MNPGDKQGVPQDLADEIVERLERESDEDWTREYAASGGKTTLPPD